MATSIKVDISVGELYDKLSILLVKQSRIADQEKLLHVDTEYKLLRKAADEFEQPLDPTIRYELARLYGELCAVNTFLWDVEDDVRTTTVEPVFVYLAKQVPELNTERYHIKRAINQLVGSKLVEEKDYAVAARSEENP